MKMYQLPINFLLACIKNRLFCALLFLGLFSTTSSYAQSTWESLAPGAGGQLQDLYFDPHVEGRIWLSSDQESSYRSDDWGQTWNFIGRDLSHGMSFKIRVPNNPNGRMFQGGLWGAHYSDDGGNSWALVPETRADAIAAIAYSSDDQTVVLAPGWQAKDPQKAQQSISDPIQPLKGERFIYLSTDGGNTFSISKYESTDGFRQVFQVFIHPTTGIIYLGAASGVYVSTDASGSAWTRIDNPTEAFGGASGGINTITLYKPDGTLDINGYKFSGGCSGMGVSPDGSRMYAVFQTDSRRWAVYSMKTNELTAGGSWELVSNNLPQEPQWYNPIVDPRSSATEHKVLLGTVYLGGANRVGLYEGTIALDGSNNITTNNWVQIMQRGGSFTFEEGWETASMLSRTYKYTPASWNERRIIAAGGNNFFLSTDPSAPGWPYNSDSWLPIYTKKSAENFGPVHTFSTAGFSNTVTYDIATYENYAVQGNADQGTLESWDYGVSWTKKTVPNGITNSQSVAIAKTFPPIVLVDARNGYGIASSSKGRLYARKLTDPTQQADASEWKIIGGGYDKSNVVGGLPNRQMQGMALDDNHPSRVFIGLRSQYSVGGIYATEELEAVFDGKANFVEISTPEMSYVNSFNDLFVDPNNSNILWAGGRKGIFKGTRSAPYTWTWEKYDGSIEDMYVWDNGGETVVAAAISSGDEKELFLLENPHQTGWNDDSRFISTGFTVDLSLSLRPQVWVEQGETISMGMMAGYKNTIFIGTENGRHKKGLGVFRGTIQTDGSVSWEDFSQDGNGKDFFYSRDASSDSKIIRESNGDIYYYVPTFGTGIWRRLIDTNTPGASLSVSRSALSLTETSGQTGEVIITSENAWNLTGLPTWLSASATSGTGNTTITFSTSEGNTSINSRQALITVGDGNKSIELLITQAGTPIPVAYVPQEISVDGLEEDIWDNVTYQNMDINLLGSTTDSRDRFKIAYTRDYLYILARIKDSTPNFEEDSVYRGDALRIAFDAGNQKKSSYSSSDFVFDIHGTGTVIPVTDNAVGIVSSSVNQIVSGYVYEIAIAWDDLGSIPTNEALHGFEIKVIDNQTGNGVSQANQWFSADDLSSSAPYNWGNLKIDGPDIPWFEPFNLPDGTLEDNGSTAWNIDLSGASLADGNDYLKVISSGEVEGRDLDGIAVLTTEVLDISTVGLVNILVKAKERGDNARDNDSNFIRLYASIDGAPKILLGELVGDAPQDNTYSTLSGVGLSGNTLQVIVEVSNDRGGTYHSIDDLLVDFGTAETCAEPSNLSVSTIESTQVELAWEASLESLTTFEIEVRPLGASTWEATTVSDATSAIITDLQAETEYEWRMRQNCITLNSGWINGENFVTLEAIGLASIFKETFDVTDCVPASSETVASYPCYSETSITYSGTTGFNDNNNDGTYEGASNGHHIFLDASGKSFQIEGINTIGFTNTFLQFAINKNGKNQDGSDLLIEITENGTDWTTVPFSLPKGDGTSGVWIVKNPVNNIGETADFGLRFTSNGSSKYRIDDIELLGEKIGSVVCDIPQNLTAENIGINTADVSWSTIATASNGYEIEWRPLGSSNWTIQASQTATSFAFDALQGNTTYEWRVRSLCSAGATSDWQLATFTTAQLQVTSLFKETHDLAGCTSPVLTLSDFACFTETTATHSGTGNIQNNLDNGSYDGASNVNHVFLDAVGEVYEISNIDLTGYTDLTLKFGVRKNGKNETGTNLLVEVSDDGTNWTEVAFTLPAGDGTNSVWQLIEEPISISATANVSVRFSTLGSIKFRIDDVELVGMEDNSANRNSPVSNLNLTSMCSDNPEQTRRWRVRNPNGFPVEVSWNVYGTDQTGAYEAPAGDSFFETATIGGSNTTKIFWLNEEGVKKSKTKASGGATCAALRTAASPLNLSEEDNVEAISVYPNPVNSYFNLQIENSKAQSLSVFDIKGQLVWEKRFDENHSVVSERINTSKWNKGIYLLKVQSESSIKVLKIFKQ